MEDAVIGRKPGELRFRVDDVAPMSLALPPIDIRKRLGEKSTGKILALSHDGVGFVDGAGTHPLIQAVGIAYGLHRPLILTPDSIWLTIAQGVAQHVENNAETLRHRFVVHADKRRIEAFVPLRDDGLDWESGIRAVTAEFREQVNATIHDRLVCDFSTTTDTIRAASQVVLMKAMRQYIDWSMVPICGIPYVILRGTEADWQAIARRVEAIEEYDLAWWTDILKPLCAHFVQAAQGAPDREFWKRIYRHPIERRGQMCGTERVDGWIGQLFPYLAKGDNGRPPTQKNPLLSPAYKPGKNFPVDAKDFPAGLSEVSVEVSDGERHRSVIIMGGFLGAREDQATEGIQAEIGWAVREAGPWEQTLAEIAADHEVNPPLDWTEAEKTIQGFRSLIHYVPVALRTLYEHFDGATLFPDGRKPLVIRPLARCELAEKSETRRIVAVGIPQPPEKLLVFADLGEKRLLTEWYGGGMFIEWVSPEGVRERQDCSIQLPEFFRQFLSKYPQWEQEKKASTSE